MQIHPLDTRADSPAQLPGQTRRQNSFLQEFNQKSGGSDTSVKDMSNMQHVPWSFADSMRLQNQKVRDPNV